MCFAWTVAKYALGQFSLEEYFDRLVDHLRRDAVRHSFDKAKSKIEDLLRVDLIGGAIKCLMLNRSFPRLSDQGGLHSRKVTVPGPGFLMLPAAVKMLQG